MPLDVDPDWWRALFDEVYLQTDARSVGDAELTRREIDVVTSLLPMAPGQRIVDLCGGQGRHSLELARRGIKDCTVVDYSKCLVRLGREEARQRGEPVSFVRSDARTTGLPDSAFDHVLVMGNSLGYLPRVDADREIVGEALRLLVPGGCLLLDVADGALARQGANPTAWHEIGDDLVVCRYRELQDERICTREIVLSKTRGLIRDRAYAIRLFDPEALAQLVADAGFIEVRLHRNFKPHECDGDFGFMNRRVIVTAKRP